MTRRLQPKAAAAGVLVLGAAIVVVLSIGIGAVPIQPARTVMILRDALHHAVAPADARDALILTQIRMPRALLGFCVGGALGVSGALLQGLFRNPLADPGLIGVSSGAALAATASIVLRDRFLPGPLAASPSLLSGAAFIGSFAATVLLYAVATRRGTTSIPLLLLAGIAFSALSGALTGLLIFISNDSQLRDLTFWMLGSLGGATWQKARIAAAIVAVLCAAVPFLGHTLNALALGDAEAYHLGLSVQRTKRLLIALVSLAVGGAVALTGPIAFVGIVVPHLLRLGVGADNRFVLPCSLLLGGIMLTMSDMLARTVAAPAEVPIGIVTAAIGGPFFLWMLLKRRGDVGL